MEWDVYLTDEVDEWLGQLSQIDFTTYEQVVVAIEMLAQAGPSLRRPLVGRIQGSSLHNLKELRPGSSMDVVVPDQYSSSRKALYGVSRIPNS